MTVEQIGIRVMYDFPLFYFFCKYRSFSVKHSPIHQTHPRASLHILYTNIHTHTHTHKKKKQKKKNKHTQQTQGGKCFLECSTPEECSVVANTTALAFNSLALYEEIQAFNLSECVENLRNSFYDLFVFFLSPSYFILFIYFPIFN